MVGFLLLTELDEDGNKLDSAMVETYRAAGLSKEQLVKAIRTTADVVEEHEPDYMSDGEGGLEEVSDDD